MKYQLSTEDLNEIKDRASLPVEIKIDDIAVSKNYRVALGTIVDFIGSEISGSSGSLDGCYFTLSDTDFDNGNIFISKTNFIKVVDDTTIMSAYKLDLRNTDLILGSPILFESDKGILLDGGKNVKLVLSSAQGSSYILTGGTRINLDELASSIASLKALNIGSKLAELDERISMLEGGGSSGDYYSTVILLSSSTSLKPTLNYSTETTIPFTSQGLLTVSSEDNYMYDTSDSTTQEFFVPLVSEGITIGSSFIINLGSKFTPANVIFYIGSAWNGHLILSQELPAYISFHDDNYPNEYTVKLGSVYYSAYLSSLGTNANLKITLLDSDGGLNVLNALASHDAYVYVSGCDQTEELL